jgi:hypothetical protein
MPTVPYHLSDFCEQCWPKLAAHHRRRPPHPRGHYRGRADHHLGGHAASGRPAMITALYAVTMLAAVFVVLTPLSASAECAWVLWSQSQYQPNPASGWFRHAVYPSYSACWSRIYELSRIPEKNSLRDWIDWTNHRGRYAKPEAVVGDAAGHVDVVEDGVEIYSGPGRVTSVRCLPDSADPRGPRGERAMSAAVVARTPQTRQEEEIGRIFG